MQHTEASPKVSILIPAFNELKHIIVCLLAVEKHMPDDLTYEIIVCDNASTDGTNAVVSATGLAKLIYRPDSCNVAEVRNNLARMARGSTLVFLDADCYVTEAWGEHLHKVVPTHRIVTGSNVVAPPDASSWVEQAYFLPMARNAGIKNYINAGHMIVDKEIFQRVGGFDESLSTGEDVDFCLRATARNFEIIPYQRLVVHHAGFPKTATGFFCRELWHGGGDWTNIHTLSKSTPALMGVMFLAVTAMSVFMAAAQQVNYAITLMSLIPMMALLVSVFLVPDVLPLKLRLQNIYLQILYVYARGLGFLTRKKTTRILKESPA